MTMRYRAVVFDLDGTLLDTLEDLYRALNTALQHFGFPPRTRDEVRRFVGNGVERLVRRALPASTEEAATGEVLAYFKTVYAAVCEEHTAPYDGIPDLLSRLRRQGIRTAVVSNKFDAATKQLCRQYFGDTVEIAVGESPDHRKKPAPDTVLAALAALDIPVTHAVYVGDSEVDIETALNVGMDCITVTWGFRDINFLRNQGATVLVGSPDELACALGL